MISKIIKNHKKVDNNKHRPANFNELANKKFAQYVDQVNNGKGWEDVPKCPVCDSTKSTIEFSKFGLEMVKCENCELRYHNKFPVDINEVYNDPNYKNESAGYWVKGEYEFRKKRFGEERVKLIGEHVGELKGKTLLDVGCGAGYFLEAAMEAGIKCDGLEPSENVRADTSNRLGIDISPLAIEDYKSEDKYDIVTSFDVIEHVKDPMVLLKNMYNMVKEGGIILLYTPNFDSFGIRVTKENSNLIAPGAHLLLFSYTSMKYALEKTGFNLEYYKTFGLDIDDIIQYEKLTDDSNFIIKWKEELQAIIDYSNCGTYMRAIGRKPK